MADLIVGEPSNLTVISDNGAGFVRVTYQPWELDWEFFDELLTDGTHFLANTTTATSTAITAKGGSEHTGYWFDIADLFPSLMWNTGDRITPQRQAAINQFATFAAAIAAANTMDAFLIWYANANNLRVWTEGAIAAANEAYSLLGMLSRMQIAIIPTILGYIAFTGNLVTQNQRINIRNFKFKATGSGGTTGVNYAPTGGQEGAGAWMSRIFCQAGTNFVNGGAAVGELGGVVNCVAWYGGPGVNWGPRVLVAHNLAFRCHTGTGFTPAGGATPVINCIGCECAIDFFVLNNTFCADTDGSLPVDPSNLRNQRMREDFRLFYDVASPGLKKFPNDHRIIGDSVLAGAGSYLAAVPRDADGRVRPNPPAIGPWEPYGPAFVPGGELIRPTLRLPTVGA